jgi:preprotein translocase subunit SecE
MAQAVAEKAAPVQPPSPGEPPRGEGGFFHVHKPGEGYTTRLGMFIVALLFVLFTCHHWFYNWISVRDFATKYLGLGFALNWTITVSNATRYVSIGGAVILFFIGAMIAYYYIYCFQRSAEFLVKTDGELAKVNWPKISPWFKSETQVWGATYVVLIVVFVLTVYVFGVDYLLQSMAHFLFYSK